MFGAKVKILFQKFNKTLKKIFSLFNFLNHIFIKFFGDKHLCDHRLCDRLIT